MSLRSLVDRGCVIGSETSSSTFCAASLRSNDTASAAIRSSHLPTRSISACTTHGVWAEHSTGIVGTVKVCDSIHHTTPRTILVGLGELRDLSQMGLFLWNKLTLGG